MVLIDGLELPTKEVSFSGGRLFELSENSIHEWFEGRRPPGDLPPDRLIGVAALEIVTTANNPPWGGDYFHWESPARQVQKVAEPWLTYLNLFDARKCTTVGMYQRSDSLLHKDSIQEVGVREPMWETQSVLEPDGDEYRYERLHRTLEIDDEGTLESLLNFLEAGRAAAAERSTHRFETALRYFSRVSEITLSHDLALVADLDECEDTIISATIGLEAIYLKKREGGKKASLSARAAALLESDHTLQAKIGEDARELYGVRSAIVHGDERAAAETLRRYSQVAERLLRRSILVFCAAQGDHARMLQASVDPAAAEVIRNNIPI